MGNEGKKRHKLSGLLQHFIFQPGCPSGKRNRAVQKQKPLSREVGCPEDQSSRVSLVPWCIPSGRDLYQGISSPAALGSKARLHPMPDHALTCFWDSALPQGPATTSSQSIPKRGQRAPVWECLSVCRSPLAGSTISPSPCSLQPGFLLHPARFTLLFPPPLPLPHGCQAMFAFLSPAVFPLPARAPPRSLPAPSSPRGSVLSQS